MTEITYKCPLCERADTIKLSDDKNIERLRRILNKLEKKRTSKVRKR